MEKVRPLEKLPLKTKLVYSKLLALMLMADKDLDQLKLAALYRLLGRINLTSLKRQELLHFIYNGEEGLAELKEQVYEGLNDQEMNIVRFSLYKDLLILMRANYIELPEEALLLAEVEGVFEITEEHKVFFEEELLQDKDFYEEKEKYCIGKTTDEAIATAAALGIPLAAICYNSYLGGLGSINLITGLHALGKKLAKRHSILAGFGIALSLGLLSYKGTKYLLGLRDRECCNLQAKMAEEMEKIHQLAIDYIEKDIFYIENKVMNDTEDNKIDEKTSGTLLLALKKAEATLKNTEALVL